HCGYWIQGDLQTAALEKALAFVIRRHESLRTVFPVNDGVPRQAIRTMEDLDFRLERIDLSGEADAGAMALDRSKKALGQLFCLQTGPLFKAEILNLGGDRFAF